MPHTLNERATSLAVLRIGQSSEIREFLEQGIVRREDSPSNVLSPTQLTDTGIAPDLVLAIDGSLQPVPVENGFPGAEVAYFSFATVLLDMGLVGRLDAERPINPAEFRTARSVTPQVTVLPGKNFRHQEDITPSACFRRQIYQSFANAGLDPSEETLLGTFEALLEHRSAQSLPGCPYPDCSHVDGTITVRRGQGTCACDRSLPIYATDWLRIQEGFLDYGNNGAAFAEYMQVVERVWLINFLRALERRDLLGVLKKTAFVMDGPLAVFGHPAWLKDAIQKELQRLNQVAIERNGQDIALLGIEKGGAFAEHLLMLDQKANGTSNKIAPGTLYLIDDSYIKENIIMSASDRPYGDQTYFGRKFFYKSKNGALVVGSTPYLREGDDDLGRAEERQHPRLADLVKLLDALISSRYPNATVPLVEAHAQAAIARGLNAQIIERLTKASVGTADGR